MLFELGALEDQSGRRLLGRGRLRLRLAGRALRRLGGALVRRGDVVLGLEAAAGLALDVRVVLGEEARLLGRRVVGRGRDVHHLAEDLVGLRARDWFWLAGLKRRRHGRSETITLGPVRPHDIAVDRHQVDAGRLGRRRVDVRQEPRHHVQHAEDVQEHGQAEEQPQSSLGHDG